MDNILPAFKTFSVEKNLKTNSSSDWIAPPSDAPIPYYLEEACSKQKALPRVNLNIVNNVLPPNERYTKDIYDSKQDPSPLSFTERGIADPTMISAPSMNESSEPKIENSERDNRKALGVRINNICSDSLELFYPVAHVIDSTAIEPDSICTRVISTGAIAEVEYMEFLHAPAHRILIQLSHSQELRSFSFSMGPIGIEVEVSEGKLLCSRVFEDSQASQYESDILRAEIISVNNHRIISLEEFEEAVYAARRVAQAQTQTLSRGRGTPVPVLTIQAIVTNTSLTDEEPQDHTPMETVLSKFLATADHMFSEEFDGGEGEGGRGEQRGSRTSIITTRKSRESSEFSDDDNGGGMMADKTFKSSAEAVESGNIHSHPSLSRGEHGSTHSIKEDKVTTATAAAAAPPLPQLLLVCCPSLFVVPKRNSTPRKLLMVTNFSSRWSIRLFCVNTDSSLIPRAILKNGDRHSEWTSTSHVWCIAVVPAAVESGFAIGSSRLTEWDSDDTAHMGQFNTEGVLSLLIRPSNSSLSDLKTASVLWTPWLSLSVTQRSRGTFTQKKNSSGEDFTPHLSVQILEH
eukprot:gene866-1688_t